MNLIFILSLFLAPVVWAQTSYVAPTKILSKRGHQLGVATDFFKTSERVDKDGNEVEYLSGEGFSRMQAELSGFYGLTENFQIGGGATFVQNVSTQQNITTLEPEDESSTGIQSTFASVIYAFKPVDRIQYTLEGLFRYRPYSNEEITALDEGKLALGDQGNELSAGLGIGYSSLTNNFATGRIGYRNPGQSLSTEIYWQLEGALVWKYVALVGGVNGVNSLNNDPNEDSPLDKPNYNTGSTYLYNGTNREFITPYLGVNVALGKTWRVEFQGSQVVSGLSTDIGTGFGVSLIRRSEPDTKQKLDSQFKVYDFEGTITKVSTKKGFVVIDKGIGDDVQKGMKIDFFEFDYVGGNILLARGVVMTAKATTSIVKIIHVFNAMKELKEGIVARGSFR